MTFYLPWLCNLETYGRHINTNFLLREDISIWHSWLLPTNHFQYSHRILQAATCLKTRGKSSVMKCPFIFHVTLFCPFFPSLIYHAFNNSSFFATAPLAWYPFSNYCQLVIFQWWQPAYKVLYLEEYCLPDSCRDYMVINLQYIMELLEILYEIQWKQ